MREINQQQKKKKKRSPESLVRHIKKDKISPAMIKFIMSGCRDLNWVIKEETDLKLLKSSFYKTANMSTS